MAVRFARLPWTTFHTRIVLALSVGWGVAGFAVTAVAAVGGALDAVPGPTGIGATAAAYLAGEAAGVLGAGRILDRLGRRRVRWIALFVFVLANALAVLAAGPLWFGAFRLFAGIAAGAEYAAVLGTVLELIPAAHRARILARVNGLYWLGGGLAAGAQLALCGPGAVPGDDGPRIGLLIAPALAVLLAGVHRLIPDSPRRLFERGAETSALAVLDRAERDARAAGRPIGTADDDDGGDGAAPGRAPLRAMLRADRPRTVAALALLAGHGFAAGGVLFTLVIMLGELYGVTSRAAPAYLLGFVLAGAIGALGLGTLLDTGKRRPPIAVTHVWAGGLLAFAGVLLTDDTSHAPLVTVALCAAFLIVAPAAAALTGDTICAYPAPLRAAAGGVLHAAGQSCGALGSLVFGVLAATGERGGIAAGYLVAGLLMVGAGVPALLLRRRIAAARQRKITPFEEALHVAAPPKAPFVEDTPMPGSSGPGWSFPAPPGRRRPGDETDVDGPPAFRPR